MNIYIYHGSLSADTINKKEYVFFDGKEYTLPDDNPKVKRMLRQKALTIKKNIHTQQEYIETKTTQKKGVNKK